MPIASGFQMEEYKILRLSVEAFPDSDDNGTIGYFAKDRIEHEGGRWTGEVMLGFRKTSESDPATVLYEIIIVGKFKLPDEDKEDSKARFRKFLRGNGAATLIPIARAALVTTSALTGHPGKHSIPNINVFDMQWNTSSDEQSAETEDE